MKPFTDEWVCLRKTTRYNEAPRDSNSQKLLLPRCFWSLMGAISTGRGVSEGAVKRSWVPCVEKGRTCQTVAWKRKSWENKYLNISSPPPANFQSPDFHWPNPTRSQRSKDSGMCNLYSFPWHKAGWRRVESGFGEPERKYTAKSSKTVIIKD